MDEAELKIVANRLLVAFFLLLLFFVYASGCATNNNPNWFVDGKKFNRTYTPTAAGGSVETFTEAK